LGALTVSSRRTGYQRSIVEGHRSVKPPKVMAGFLSRCDPAPSRRRFRSLHRSLVDSGASPRQNPRRSVRG
jgi:hypothetical protein